MPKKTRVISYIDGFNIYYGLKEKSWKRYYWLNVARLSELLLPPDHTLLFTKYFTSMISSNPVSHKRQRQEVFINALKTVPRLELIFGQYRSTHQQCSLCKSLQYCRNCKQPIIVYKEKMTDVNIAIELVSDAHQDKYDTALLVSGDSDLTGAVDSVLKVFPKKRIIVAFPPERQSGRLSKSASHSFVIGRAKFRDSQFPETITKPNGNILTKPTEWV